MSTLGAKWKELSTAEKQVYVDQSKMQIGEGTILSCVLCFEKLGPD
jgi:hypothetical protein